jgi:hypothetical protein
VGPREKAKGHSISVFRESPLGRSLGGRRYIIIAFRLARRRGRRPTPITPLPK